MDCLGVIPNRCEKRKKPVVCIVCTDIRDEMEIDAV